MTTSRAMTSHYPAIMHEQTIMSNGGTIPPHDFASRYHYQLQYIKENEFGVASNEKTPITNFMKMHKANLELRAHRRTSPIIMHDDVIKGRDVITHVQTIVDNGVVIVLPDDFMRL
jgi:hypothetical protein